jgi:NADH-quinone oxidoreductase subunit F
MTGERILEKPLTGDIKPGQQPPDLKGYEKGGGYRALRRALKEMTPSGVQEMVSASNLRGRGGAGFPTGKKWSVVPMGEEARQPKYMVVNADEMEPGTFKDRFLLEGNPHLLIEGAIIAAFAIQASVAYVFIRREYPVATQRVRKAIGEAYEGGFLGTDILGSGYSFEMHMHVSAGRYICGEEDGLLDALEGKRPIPRSKPPFPQTCGLWGKPTLVNNVETLCNVPHIVNNGAEWFKKLSHTGDGGTKLYGASGRVKRPGLWELPMGTTLREIFEEHAGGMKDGYTFRGVQPGGASTDFLMKEHLDVKMDYDSVQKVGSRLGTGTIVVLDDRTCPVGAVHNLLTFFARESCGWCTPCREGLPWIRDILLAIEEGRGEEGDLERLSHQCWQLSPHYTFCALAPGAVEPLQSALKYFKDDFEKHIREKRCPWR